MLSLAAYKVATLAWVLFGLAVLWSLASQRLNHRKRIRLLLADNSRANAQELLRAVDSSGSGIERAGALNAGTPGRPGYLLGDPVNRRVTVGALALSLLVGAATAEADNSRRAHTHTVQPIYVPSVLYPYYYVPPPSYEFYYQQELQRRLQRPPEAPKSFEGSSPRCPRFFCESTR
jgi:hypothetical protein